MVYVYSVDGRALRPTNRHGRVRRLLKSGLASVIIKNPPTIQLNYSVDSENHTYSNVPLEGD